MPKITDKIITTKSTDLFATHDSNLGEGGLHIVDTISDRDNISSPRKKVGMLVNVISDTAENNSIYELISLSPETWDVYKTKSSFYSVESITERDTIPEKNLRLGTLVKIRNSYVYEVISLNPIEWEMYFTRHKITTQSSAILDFTKNINFKVTLLKGEEITAITLDEQRNDLQTGIIIVTNAELINGWSSSYVDLNGDFLDSFYEGKVKFGYNIISTSQEDSNIVEMWEIKKYQEEETSCSVEITPEPIIIDDPNAGHLKQITEGVNTGYCLKNQDRNLYGTIGVNAVDLSFSTLNGNYGATGSNSFSIGNNTIAGGIGSFSQGLGTFANTEYKTAFGKYNRGLSDTILEVGIGTSISNKKNVLELYYDGRATLPNLENFDSEDSIITKKFLQTYVSVSNINVFEKPQRIDLIKLEDPFGSITSYDIDFDLGNNFLMDLSSNSNSTVTINFINIPTTSQSGVIRIINPIAISTINLDSNIRLEENFDLDNIAQGGECTFAYVCMDGKVDLSFSGNYVVV